jgi:hypothetical protein
VLQEEIQQLLDKLWRMNNMLPKIDYPLYEINIPSLKKRERFRPFLVKEEKLLLMAKQSENDSDILLAIKQIITNCSVENKFDINKLTVFDLEYVFLKLRSFSIDNKIKVSYKDNEDNKVYDFEINLDEVEVIIPEKLDNNIKITNESGIIMKYPSASLYDDQEFLNLQKDHLFELIVRCIDKIYNGEDVYEASEYKRENLREFLEQLDIKTFEKIQDFLIASPKMEHKIHYKNSNGNDREIVLSSLNDFFTWR